MEHAVTETQESTELQRDADGVRDDELVPPPGLLRILLIGGQTRLWRDALRRRMLAASDLVTALLVCLSLALLAGLETGVWVLVVTPVWLILAKLFGLYDRDHRALRHLTIDELPVLCVWVLVSMAATVAFLEPAPPSQIGFATAVAVWAIATAAAGTLRAFARWLWRRMTPPELTLILGDGPIAKATARKLELFPDIHVAVIGRRDWSSSPGQSGGPDWPPGLNRVIVAAASVDEERLAELIAHCRHRQVKLSVVPPVRGMFGTAVQLNHVADLPVVEYSTWDVSRSTLFLKRGLDLVVGVPLLLLIAPLIAVIALAIRFDRDGPVFFVQRRAGLGGRPFRMIKFRTMVSGRGGAAGGGRLRRRASRRRCSS